MPIHSITLDIETFCELALKKTGVYPYALHPSFQILLVSLSVDGGPIQTYDLASGEKLPDEILRAIVDDHVIKYAFNANFERVCLSSYINQNYPEFHIGYGAPEDSVGGYLNPVSWRCDLVLSAYNGLPLSLAGVGEVLGFEKQKLSESKDLVRYFSTPCKPTKVNGGRTKNTPFDSPDKWADFKKYNVRDVEVQIEIHDRLQRYPVIDAVWQEYIIDQIICDRGIRIDQRLVENAIKIDALTKDSITKRMKEITGLDNPNSVSQLKGWLSSKGIEVESLGKKQVQELIKTVPDDVKEVLELRLQLAKSSVKKYEAMQSCMCPDGRCRGLFQFYGANRTGRWAGRLIQLQNLPQNHMPDLDLARSIVREGDYELLDLLYDNIPQVLSELIRTAFIPKERYKYVVSDFSAIEARVLSYLAGETWRSKVFAEGGDIDCASASAMFHCRVVKGGENGKLRAKGKIAELALGYGGSVGALKAMGALDMGLKEEELQPLVDRWRSSNPHICAHWWAVDKAVKDTVRLHIPSQVESIKFYWKSGVLFVKLPSGRTPSYINPQIGTNKFGGESVTYMGIDSTKHWSRLESYGPKFVENAVQGIARDILCTAMKRLKDRFIVGHVHDELIIEVPMDTELQEICDIMGQTPDWTPGLVLRADGYECLYYKKD